MYPSCSIILSSTKTQSICNFQTKKEWERFLKNCRFASKPQVWSSIAILSSWWHLFCKKINRRFWMVGPARCFPTEEIDHIRFQYGSIIWHLAQCKATHVWDYAPEDTWLCSSHTSYDQVLPFGVLKLHLYFF